MEVRIDPISEEEVGFSVWCLCKAAKKKAAEKVAKTVDEGFRLFHGWLTPTGGDYEIFAFGLGPTAIRGSIQGLRVEFMQRRAIDIAGVLGRPLKSKIFN